MSLKTLIGTAIISLGIAGLVFISKNNVNLLKTGNKTTQETLNGNNPVSNQPFVEKLLPSNKSNTSLEENLTELFAKNLGKIVLDNNPDGPANIDGKKGLVVPEPESIAAELLAEAAQKFDPATLRPIIKDQDLKISEDNSKESLNNYILNFQKLVKDSAEKIPSSVYATNEDELSLKDIQKLVEIYQESIKQFYKLSTPKSAIAIQKKQIELLTAKKNIFEKIVSYQQDPLIAILAAPELKRVDLDFSELSKNFLELIKISNS